MKKEMTKELVVKIGEYLLLVETYATVCAEMEKQGASDTEIDEATKEICTNRMRLIKEVNAIDSFWANEMIVNSAKIKEVYGI